MMFYRQYEEGMAFTDKQGKDRYFPEDMLCADVNDHPNWEVVSINSYTKMAGTSPDKQLRCYALFYRDTLGWERDSYDEGVNESISDS